MLDSTKISRRQSEIRQALAGIVGKATPSEDEVRQMEALDLEYRTGETRFRAALIAEDQERREAGADLETRGEREFAELVGKFELRQAALALDEGRQIDGATAEIVQELRSKGGFRGIPIPWQVLERRAGETIASGTPNPVRTMPIIDRLFPASVAGKMGVQAVQIDSGELEYPITTSSVAAGWASSETGNVAGPTTYATGDIALKPEQNPGIQLRVTWKALKQSGSGLEDAMRRDLQGAMAAELDKATFLGTDSSGQPLGIVTGAGTYGITATAIDAAASWSAFRTAVSAFLAANAATAPSDVRVLIRPELWAGLDGTYIAEGSSVTEWERLVSGLMFPLGLTSGVLAGGSVSADRIVMSANALAAPS